MRVIKGYTRSLGLNSPGFGGGGGGSLETAASGDYADSCNAFCGFLMCVLPQAELNVVCKTWERLCTKRVWQINS